MTAIRLNTVHHMDNREGMAALPKKCASLIIADPPYFEVKGEFDFIWKSFDEYLEFMEEQAKAYKRILAENGTLYVYGHAKKIAYVQVIFDKYFGLVNSLVWEKAERDGLFGSTGSEQLRSFPNSTERVLMYCHTDDPRTGWEQAIRTPELWAGIKGYFVSEFNKSGMTIMEANKVMGYAITGSSVAGGLFLVKKKDFVMPTERAWDALQTTGYFKKSYTELESEYNNCCKKAEGIATELEKTRRQFDNFSKSTEVLKFRFVPSDHDHETVKPDSICNCLIMTSSRKGDLVVVPFAGSGSECVAAKKKGREFIGFDTTLKYVEMANERVRKETRQKEMF